MSLLSAAAVTAGTLLSRRLTGLDLVTATAWRLLMGAAGLMVFAAAVEGSPVIAWTPFRPLGVPGPRWYRSDDRGVVRRGAPQPARHVDGVDVPDSRSLSIGLASVALGERPGGWTAVGLLGVLAAMWITHALRPPRRAPTHPTAVGPAGW